MRILLQLLTGSIQILFYFVKHILQT